MPAALTITGNTNDALAAIAKLERQYDQLEQKVKRLGSVSKQAADQGASAFGSMTQGALSFATAVTGVGTVLDGVVKTIDLAKREWEDFVQRQEKSLNSNKAFAQNLTRFALATDTPLPEAKAMMLRMSQQHNVNLQDIPAMLNAFQAAKGPTQNMGDVERMFGAAAALGKFDPESMQRLGSSGLDITKQMPGTTAEQALGFSLAAQSLSRVADPAHFNKNVMPAVLGGNKISGTPLEVGVALSNALTHASGDETGRRSATAQISLEMQMKEAFPELADTAERIKYMRDNPDIREGFLKGLKNEIVGPDGTRLSLEGYHGERRMQPAIQALLTEGSAESRIYDETLRTLVPLNQAHNEYARRAKEMARDPTMQAVELDRSLQNSAEQKRIADTEAARAAASRLGLDENLSAAGVGWSHRQMLGWGRFSRTRMGQGEQEASLNVLDAEMNRISGMLNDPNEANRQANLKYFNSLRGVRDTMSFGYDEGGFTPFDSPAEMQRKAKEFDQQSVPSLLQQQLDEMKRRGIARNGQVEQ